MSNSDRFHYARVIAQASVTPWSSDQCLNGLICYSRMLRELGECARVDDQTGQDACRELLLLLELMIINPAAVEELIREIGVLGAKSIAAFDSTEGRSLSSEVVQERLRLMMRITLLEAHNARRDTHNINLFTLQLLDGFDLRHRVAAAASRFASENNFDKGTSHGALTQWHQWAADGFFGIDSSTLGDIRRDVLQENDLNERAEEALAEIGLAA